MNDDRWSIGDIKYEINKWRSIYTIDDVLKYKDSIDSVSFELT